MMDRRQLLSSVLGQLLAVADGRALEKGAPLQEADIKAALVLNICRFVEWPSAPARSGRKSFVIGTFARDEVGRSLETLSRGKQIAGLPVEIAKVGDLTDLLDCDAFFLPREELRRTTQILGMVRKVPVLTLGDSGGFLNLGGMVGLIAEGDRIHFEIRAEAAERVGLRVSSKLLRLAGEKGARP